MSRLSVHYLPQFIDEWELAESVVVVIDLLRASTTICHALSAGASCVVPFVEVDAARARAQSYAQDEVVLGGERGGLLIEGFDLGNSPTEYSPERVFGKTVIFTTTNGARALAHAHLAKRVLVGAAVNRQALVAALADAPAVDILCAGTNGNVTREDILAAGAVVEGLLSLSNTPWEKNEWAEAAWREWQELLATGRASGRTPSEQLAWELRDTPGGRNLLAIGHDFDLDVCAQLDTLDLLPELDRQTGVICL